MIATDSYTLFTPTSSNLSRVTYYDSNETLEVEFKTGSVYQYFDVPQTVGETFKTVIESGSSAGKFLNEHIKGRFRYSKV
jgi:hypothetical protein